MDEKGRKINWLKSILFNLFVMTVVMLLTHMVYETNDDFAISSRIVDNYPEIDFINYYYCCFLTKLQQLVPILNMHVICQIALSLISFVCILKLVMDSSRSKIVIIAACALIAFFSIDQYSTIQFTKTAALVTASGALMLIDAIAKLRNPIYFIFGALLFLVGAGLRTEGAIVPFGFAGIYAIYWITDNRSNLGENLGKRIAALVLVMITIVGGSLLLWDTSLKANKRTEELKEYVDYNYLRTEVADFSRLDYYEEQKADYDKAGFSEGDIKLIKAWVFDYDGAASTDNLRTIIEISDNMEAGRMTIRKAVKEFIRETIKGVKNRTATGAHIIVLAILGIWIMLSGRGSSRFFVILTALATVTLHIYIYYIERPAYRAFYVPDICAAVFMIYALASLGELPKWKYAPGFAATILILALIVPVYNNSETIYNSNSGRVMSAEFVNFLDSHKDRFYVVGTREKKINPDYLTPWKAPDTSRDANCMGTGSWGTKSPYILEKLAAYDMTNPIKDLIDNDKARYVGNKNIKNLSEYYNKWYGTKEKKIVMEEDGEIDGLKIWKVRSK